MLTSNPKDDNLDNLIMQNINSDSQKTLRIMYLVGKKLNDNSDMLFERIEERLRELSGLGKIKVRGDVSDWRGSEVSL